MKKEISITINGEIYQQSVPIRILLVDFIRDVAGLTGTHVGCTFEGVCGACTVHVDGEAVKSCLMLAVQADRPCNYDHRRACRQWKAAPAAKSVQRPSCVAVWLLQCRHTDEYGRVR